jgi:GNAT superfamily N-acetyltransferase
MNVRAATELDIAEMHRVRLAVRENRLSDPARIGPDDYREMLASRGRGWVCEIDDRIVGFGVADLARSNIWALFVEPECEGRGIGRRLHDAMLDWLFANGAQRVWLTTAPNSRAERFYRRARWHYAGAEPSGEARYEITAEMRGFASPDGAHDPARGS